MVAMAIGFVGLWLVFAGIVALTGIHWGWSISVGGLFLAILGFGGLDVNKTTSGR
jgi:hypothetical protein